MPRPDPIVLLDDGTGTFPHDISEFVDLKAGISITRGRSDKDEDVAPSTCSLSLDNTDGRFTPGSATYDISVGTRIRVGNVVNGSTFWRFTGYVYSWPVEWPNGGKQTYSQITAYDRLAQLERVTLRAPLYDDVMALEPDGYYPLVGGSDVARASISGTPQPVLGEDPSMDGAEDDIQIEYETMEGPGSYGAMVPRFRRTWGSLSTGSLENRMNPGLQKNDWSFGFYFQADASTHSGGALDYLFNCYSPRDDANLTIAVDQFDGRVYCIQYDNTTGIAVSNLQGPYVMDGEPHFVVVVETGGVRSLYVDHDILFGPSHTHAITIPISYRYAFVVGWRWRGSISHLFYGPAIADVSSTNLPLGRLRAAIYQADGNFATAGHLYTVAQRAGFTDAEMSLPGGYDEYGSLILTLPVDTEGMTPPEAMALYARAEGSIIYIDGSGILHFPPRDTRHNPTPAVALPSHMVGEDTTFLLDDSQIVNDATVTLRDGTERRVTDDASIATYGTYSASTELPFSGRRYSDLTIFDLRDFDAAEYAARSMVARGANPEPRVSQMTIDILTIPEGSLYGGGVYGSGPYGGGVGPDTVMALELGDLITITDLPTQAPSSTVDLFVEGWTEEIGAEVWSLAVNTSPGTYAQVWRLGDPVLSELGSTTRLAY